MDEQRNQLIYAGRKAGLPAKVLAKQYGVSPTRIAEICRQEAWREAHPDDASAIAKRELDAISLLEARGYTVTPPSRPEHVCVGLTGEVEDLYLSTRALGVLKRSGIATIEQLRRTPDQDLRRLPNCGVKIIAEIKEVLALSLS